MIVYLVFCFGIKCKYFLKHFHNKLFIIKIYLYSLKKKIYNTFMLELGAACSMSTLSKHI